MSSSGTKQGAKGSGWRFSDESSGAGTGRSGSVRSLSLALRHATPSDQGFQSNAWVPDLFGNPQFPSLRLPPLSPKRGQRSRLCSLGGGTGQVTGEGTSLPAESPHLQAAPAAPACRRFQPSCGINTLGRMFFPWFPKGQDGSILNL